jgi:hypothetical protein
MDVGHVAIFKVWDSGIFFGAQSRICTVLELHYVSWVLAGGDLFSLAGMQYSKVTLGRAMCPFLLHPCPLF